MGCLGSMSSCKQPEVVQCGRIWLPAAISMVKSPGELKYCGQSHSQSHSNPIWLETSVHTHGQQWMYRWALTQYPCEYFLLNKQIQHLKIKLVCKRKINSFLRSIEWKWSIKTETMLQNRIRWIYLKRYFADKWYFKLYGSSICQGTVRSQNGMEITEIGEFYGVLMLPEELSIPDVIYV